MKAVLWPLTLHSYSISLLDLVSFSDPSFVDKPTLPLFLPVSLCANPGRMKTLQTRSEDFKREGVEERVKNTCNEFQTRPL